MIEKMRFVSLSGPLSELDETIATYLTKYDIHLENALSELHDNHLRPILDANPYQKPLDSLASTAAFLDLTDITPQAITTEDALEIAEELTSAVDAHREKQAGITQEYRRIKEYHDSVAPYIGLEANLQDITSMKFIKYRFGRIGMEYFRKFEQIINDESHAIFLPCTQTQDFVYGVYFVPMSEYQRLDTQLYALHFERFHVPDDEKGTPAEVCEIKAAQLAELDQQLEACENEIRTQLQTSAQALVNAQHHLALMHSCFDVRKKAAITSQGDSTSFILCGWMPAGQADTLKKELAGNDRLRMVVDDANERTGSAPPTKFKNPAPFRPFEMYTEMYGLPAYSEFDPTIFIGITYSFIFGWMFGDVGQGACLAIFGFLLYFLKHMKLAGIIGFAGIFSTFFGFMFGSVFGFEDVIPAYWMHPKEAMSQLPFVGNLNTVFAVAITFGMGMILVTIILNIINSLRVHDLENGLFSQNGVAGLVFYGTLVAVILLFMTDHKLPAGILLAILFILPIACMALKEPLAHWLTKKKAETKTGIGMFIAQAFFELFEIMLSYFSNTLSFVRIGAFAISHAAMMEVVMMLAGAEAGNPNLVVVILGNVFVMGMEGLVVGIQVLRLEYYEFFSRFYRGTGRPFVSLKKTISKF